MELHEYKNVQVAAMLDIDPIKESEKIDYAFEQLLVVLDLQTNKYL